MNLLYITSKYLNFRLEKKCFVDETNYLDENSNFLKLEYALIKKKVTIRTVIFKGKCNLHSNEGRDTTRGGKINLMFFALSITTLNSKYVSPGFP